MKISELLSDESKFTRETFARDKFGISVIPQSERAVCWCTTGAIWRCYPENYDDVRDRIVDILVRHGYATPPGRYCDIASWNDSVSFEQVREVLLEANV